MRPFRVFRNRGYVAALCLLLVGVIGYVDYISGFENSMLLFYLAPIAVATWFLGTGFGVAMCALSVVAADVADIAAGVPAITIWNSLTSFCAYLIITILFRRVHLLLIEMDSRVKERTSALQQELARRQELEIEIARIGEEERGR